MTRSLGRRNSKPNALIDRDPDTQKLTSYTSRKRQALVILQLQLQANDDDLVREKNKL